MTASPRARQPNRRQSATASSPAFAAPEGPIAPLPGLGEEGEGVHHYAGGAEATLDAALFDEGLLERVQLPLLFQRILQNTIRDFFRRQKVRALWTTPVSSLIGADSEDEYDPLETLAAAGESKADESPQGALERSQLIALIEKALQKLPARQREAFILRYWEELDVAEAAKIMGCSEGSVKTHCSRATHALAAMLRIQGIKL